MVRILDAFELLLRRSPYETLTINDIAREANTGAGSIYARFRDKRSILLAVQDRLRLRAKSYFEELYTPACWSDATIDEALDRVVRSNLAWFRSHQHIVKSALLLDDKDILEATVKSIRPINAIFAALLQHHVPALPDAAALHAATRIIMLMLAVFQQKIIFGEIAPSGHELPDDEVVQTLVVAALAQFAAT